jgi:dephospho-CoA kinase
MQRALRVGITGKMGSGKSTLSALLREKGITILDADTIAKEIMTKDPVVRNELTNVLGSAAYTDGTLNRKFIAEKIFSDAQLRREVERIVHPRVTLSMRKSFEDAPAGTAVGFESALILQTELWREFDYIVLVTSPEEQILTRITTAGSFSRADAEARLREQSVSPEELDEADFTIENSSTLAQFGDRASFLLTILPVLAQRDLPELPLHQLELSEEDAISLN